MTKNRHDGRSKVIACDVDGVLVQSGDGVDYSWHKALGRDFGIRQDQIDAFFQNDWDACILGEADLRDVLPPYLEEWGFEGTADDFMAFWFHHDSHLDTALVGEIKRLRPHYRLVLATNQEHHRSHFLWQELALSDVFEHMFASSALGKRKPDQAFWDAVTEALGIARPDDILLIDDSEKNVEAARRFGWQAIHYNDRSDLDDLLGAGTTT